MSPFEPVPQRTLVIDTNTPGTEIFVINAEGQPVASGIRKLEAELPLALYKIRYRVGDRVADRLIELTPGENPLYVSEPQLPIFSPAPATALTGTGTDHPTQLARRIIAGPPTVAGSGASLFVFVTADETSGTPLPPNPAAGLTVCKFSGEQVMDLRGATTDAGCAGCNVALDPGHYLLRAVLDSGPPVEQTIVVARDWQTRIYIRLIETGTPETPKADLPNPGWRLDLPRLGIIMVRDRDVLVSGPSEEDARWTSAARQALAARRSEAAPNREMMQALLKRKFENPMLGIYAGHLLAMQSNPDLELLREVYSNLSSLVGDHPDVQALLIALNDPQAMELKYQEPPMLFASWALILRARKTGRDLRPERSYSARVAASLWGSGAWLSWRMPPPDSAAVQLSPATLQALIDEASAGRLGVRLNDLEKRNVPLSPIERVLAAQLMAMDKRLQLADEWTADDDSGSFFGGGRYILPVFRRFVASELQKQTREKIAGDLDAEKLSDWSGIPYSALREAASTLGEKLGLAQPSPSRNFLKWGRS